MKIALKTNDRRKRLQAQTARPERLLQRRILR